MKLVIDANILMAALIKDSKTRELLKNEQLELLAPGFLKQELAFYQKEIRKKARLSKKEFDVLSNGLQFYIQFIESAEIKPHLKEALHISPDKKDAPYFALCLKNKTPLWSNDKELKKQSIVTVYSTEVLASVLELKTPTILEQLEQSPEDIKRGRIKKWD